MYAPDSSTARSWSQPPILQFKLLRTVHGTDTTFFLFEGAEELPSLAAPPHFLLPAGIIAPENYLDPADCRHYSREVKRPPIS